MMGIFGCVDYDCISRAFGYLFPGWLGRSIASCRNTRSLGPLLAPVILLSGSVAAADTVNYQYDELGRLTGVERIGASVSTYGYDAGGNRTQTTVALTPGVPASISVPASSTGSHTISWSAASGTVTAYELYQSSNSNFSGQILAYSGTGTSKSVSVQSDGTYYYRARACNEDACSAYRSGSNGVSVTIPPPGTPASISVPSSSTTGSYTISWGSSSGTVTAYNLYEATNSSFSGQTLVHSGTATSKPLSGRGNGTYYYRVRACNGPKCSGYRTGGNPTTVTLPPSKPASISVPSSSNTGSYTISWGSSSGNVTAYKLYEATNSSFSGQTLVYSGTGTSKALSGQSDGSYYYRVRACNGSSCSGYRTGANPTTVTLPPAAPATISGPFQSTGSYTISWSSSAGATRYELWESKFGGGYSEVYDGPNTAKSFNSKPAGEYRYKAKACNAGGCSGFSPTRLVTVCSGPCQFQAPPVDP